MQSKGAIRFIAIAFAIVCLYQLSFTWKTHQVESQAKQFAKGDSSLEHRYLDSVKGESVYNLGIQKYTYSECKEREINLGLDLKGGMNVTLEVSIPEIIRALSNNSLDPTFNKALSNAVEKEKSSQKDFVTIFGEEFQKLDPNARLSALFSNASLQDKVSLNSTNDEVLKIIKKEADDAFESTYKILRTRIDKFGVAQPNIQKLTGSGRIMVELPGVKDKDRVRKLLQGTAKLEFWETFNLKEIYPDLTKADQALRSIIDYGSDTTGGKDSAKVTTSKDTTAKGKKIAGAKDTTAKDTSSKLALAQTLNKNDSTSSSDTGSTAFKTADAAKKNPLFALLFNIPPKTNEEAKAMEKSPIMGSCLIKDTAKVNSYLAMPSIKSLFPTECKFLWTVKPSRFKDKNILELIAIKIPGREGKAKLEGDAIVDASQDFGQMDHRPEITMEMNPDGANTWRRMTAENKERSIAIVLDDYVYSYPNVINEIPNGRSSITGNFEVNEAKDLANILKAGKLPAPAKIVEESIVGPSLGEEAINNSLVSFIIAFIVILIFMGWYYMRAGWVANVALFTNIFFMMGVLASLGCGTYFTWNSRDCAYHRACCGC
jgi:SecD/SecF fusion protein